MSWLLWSAAALVIVMLIGLTMLSLAANSHIDPGDIEADDDDEDDTEPTAPLIVNSNPYINPVPPFSIRHIGRSGQHDRYQPPFTDEHRQLYIDYLDAMWNLPAREHGGTR